VDDADDAVDAQSGERVRQRRRPALGGVAATPDGRVERPADLDVFGPESVVGEADAAYEVACRALLDRPEPVATLGPVPAKTGELFGAVDRFAGAEVAGE
jgi:hypothetical protein